MEKKPVVMLVEDNATTQETLKRDLEPLGLDVLIAPSAEDAWKLLESGTNPDVLILDFNLPGGEDGPTFFRRIRLDSKYKTLPVIPFTALLDKLDGASHSKVSNFISSRKPEASHIHKIVSKNGREDIYKTPEDLIIEIGRDLDKKYTVLPEAFRTERKRCLDLRVQKMKTEDNEHS